MKVEVKVIASEELSPFSALKNGHPWSRKYEVLSYAGTISVEVNGNTGTVDDVLTEIVNNPSARGLGITQRAQIVGSDSSGRGVYGLRNTGEQHSSRDGTAYNWNGKTSKMTSVCKT